MAFEKTFIADDENLRLLMHNDILGFTFEVLNDDLTDFDFGAFTDVFLRIYNKKRGFLVLTIPNNLTNGVSIATNIITWNATYSTDIKLFTARSFYYELSFLDVDSKFITVLKGNFEIE